MDIERTFKAIVEEQLGVDDPEAITLTAHLVHDLGADSLDRIELMMACEEEFGIEISDEDAERLITVGDVVGYLTRRVGAAASVSGS